MIASIGFTRQYYFDCYTCKVFKTRRQYQYSKCIMAFHGDLLNSIGVIVAVVLIYFTWRIIDPIISIVISLIILRGGYKITRNAWLILMESVLNIWILIKLWQI